VVFVVVLMIIMLLSRFQLINESRDGDRKKIKIKIGKKLENISNKGLD